MDNERKESAVELLQNAAMAANLSYELYRMWDTIVSGDARLPGWDNLPIEVQRYAFQAALLVFESKGGTAEEIHNRSVEMLRQHGWVEGTELDVSNKRTPFLQNYRDAPIGNKVSGLLNVVAAEIVREMVRDDSRKVEDLRKKFAN